MIFEVKLKTYFCEESMLYFNGKVYSLIGNEPMKISQQPIKFNDSIYSINGSCALDRTDLLLLRKINEL